MERARSILDELSGEPSPEEAARQRDIGRFNRANERFLERKAGREEGREEGRQALVRSVLAVLNARGIALGEAQHQQLRDCRDLATLERWLRQSVSASTADEALAP